MLQWLVGRLTIPGCALAFEVQVTWSAMIVLGGRKVDFDGKRDGDSDGAKIVG